MAITLTPLTPKLFGFVVNATTADASGAEVLQAAPGTGKHLEITQISIMCASAITVTIGEGVSGAAVEKAIVGPVSFTSTGAQYAMSFLQPLILTDDKSLSLDASGAGDIAVFASGTIED